MDTPPPMDDLNIEISDHVAIVEFCRPPSNFFDTALICRLADAFEALDRDADCRAILLCSEGKHFCAGAQILDGVARESDRKRPAQRHLYQEALRIVRASKPVVASIQGAAIGGGLGLALLADFRIACNEARFSANFTRLGLHPGFGMTATLPRLIGIQQTALMLYSGRRIDGAEALRIGLIDGLVDLADVRAAAFALAGEIAGSAPLAVAATRATLRRGLADLYEAATERELTEQRRLLPTEDYLEGTGAMTDRRIPHFQGR